MCKVCFIFCSFKKIEARNLLLAAEQQKLEEQRVAEARAELMAKRATIAAKTKSPTTEVPSASPTSGGGAFTQILLRKQVSAGGCTTKIVDYFCRSKRECKLLRCRL